MSPKTIAYSMPDTIITNGFAHRYGKVKWQSCIVCAMAWDRHFRFQAGLESYHCHNGGHGCKSTWTVSSGMVQKCLPTCQNWARCQWVVQRVYLLIHMILLFLLLDNYILPKSLIQYPVSHFACFAHCYNDYSGICVSPLISRIVANPGSE